MKEGRCRDEFAHSTQGPLGARAKLRRMTQAPHSSASWKLGLTLLGLAMLSSSALAATQWKWRDASGAVQYSDRPPPAGTPEASILSRPAAAVRQAQKAATDAAASAASAAASFAAPAGKAQDPELEARRRKTEDDKRAQAKAEEDKQAKVRAENCQRARSYQRTLADGIRIARTNDKGEREILDDKGRADEAKRTQEIIQSSCGK